jgi:4-hydroxybenzoate polyprenyltransferase
MITRVKELLALVQFSHTIFALPFALMGALLAADGLPQSDCIWWIVVAMVAARTGAMGVNRLLDRQVDAANPRTQDRSLPAGRLNNGQVFLLIVTSYAVFVFAASRLNQLCFILAPYVIILLSAYSLTKHFTHYTHFFLGICLGISPLAAWIAVTGTIAWTPVWLGLAVVCWVAGFDLLYALQDIDFDREHGLHSLPTRIGIPATLRLAKRLHLAMLALLLLVFFSAPGLSWLFAGGWLATAILLHIEHDMLRPDDLSHINAAFFTVNGWISLSLFVVTALDLLLLKG